MKRYFDSLKQNSTSLTIGIALSVFFIAVSVQAATVIGTNIQTDGTLNVTGQSILTGNLGIGTTSPYSILSVSNSASTAANTPLFTIASTSAGTATSTLMTVLANGGVGIGTGETLGLLHLQKTADGADNTGLVIQNSGTSAGTAVSIALGSTNNSTYFSGATHGTTRLVSTRQSNGSADLNIILSPGGGVAQASVMYLKGSTGHIGIGTTTPIVPFQVTTASSNATTSVEIGKTGQNKGSCLVLYDAAGTAVYAYVAAGATAFTLSATSCK